MSYPKILQHLTGCTISKGGKTVSPWIVRQINYSQTTKKKLINNTTTTKNWNRTNEALPIRSTQAADNKRNTHTPNRIEAKIIVDK